jgi:hypothetical protein
MPFQREFDLDDRVLRTTIVGPVTLYDIDDHLKAIRRRRGESRPELIDARLAEPGSLTPRSLLLVAHRARFLMGHRALGRRAVVVSSDSAFIVARRFAAFVAGWLRIGVFDDMEAAEAWVRQPAWLESVARLTRVASL